MRLFAEVAPATCAWLSVLLTRMAAATGTSGIGGLACEPPPVGANQPSPRLVSLTLAADADAAAAAEVAAISADRWPMPRGWRTPEAVEATGGGRAAADAMAATGGEGSFADRVATERTALATLSRGSRTGLLFLRCARGEERLTPTPNRARARG